MRDAALALLTSHEILEREAQDFPPSTSRAYHAESALAHITACLAFTRATSLPGMRGKLRLLLRQLPHGTPARALAVSLLRDLGGLERCSRAADAVSKLT